MLVGIRIELLQPGFDLFHQPIFWYRKVTSSITPLHPSRTTQAPIKLREWLDARYNLRITASRSAKHAHE
jgi:hypothetical protein